MADEAEVKEHRLLRHQTADCSFMLTSSLSSPNIGKLISAIASILHNQIEADSGRAANANAEFAIFDEETYLEGIQEEKQTRRASRPSSAEIFDFIATLYDTAQYSVECNVLALLYVNRLIAFSGLTLNDRNWRPILFTALLIAQKVWDDKLLSNATFAAIYPFFTAEEMNRLEAVFLNLLQFEVVVKPSTYAKYYFELRAVQENSYGALPSAFSDTAEVVEARSRRFRQSAYRRFGDPKSMTTV
ncbi:hypothetical protein Efla_003894 [Eimeria flavescens]